MKYYTEYVDLLVDELVKSRHSGEACAGLDPVTGVQDLRKSLDRLDSGFHRNDRKRGFRLFTKLSLDACEHGNNIKSCYFIQ